MSDETKPLPCPFCGGEAIVDNDVVGFYWLANCPACGACGPASETSSADAIAAWNRRAPSPRLGLVAAWQSSKRHAEEWMKLCAAADEHEWIRQRCERAGDLIGLRAATELAALARAEECRAHADAAKAEAELAAMLDALEAEVTP